MKMKMDVYFKTAVVEKRAKLEYRHIENNDTWDIINRVCADPAERIYQGFDIILRMADMAIRVFSLLAILFTQVWWAGLITFVLSFPLLYISVKSGKTNYDAFKEAAKYERRAEYLQEVLTGRENVDERSMFRYTDSVNKKWYEKFEIARKIKLKMRLKNYMRMNAGSSLTILIWFLIACALMPPLANGELSVGMFIGLISAAFSITQMASWELAHITDELAGNNEYLRDLSEFFILSEQEGALDLPNNKEDFNFESIEFCSVSFKYPGTDNYILKDCSFKINKNTQYAFVGVNGAGKTTITKLLTGLYSGFDGNIYINGKSIKEYSHAQLKSFFTVVHQDFAKYYISMRDNIELGNITKVNGFNNESKKMQSMELDSLIKKLPYGIDTYLGKIKENGIDLSGGEWQKIAIARTLISDAPIRILDEPTASLDPIAESNIYEMFSNISKISEKAKTQIFITHRLGAAKFADVILVIADGRVAEQGTHDALISENGAQILSALHALTWVLATIFDQKFFDNAALFANNEISYGVLITSLCFLFLINVTNRFLNGIVNFLPRACYEKVRGNTAFIIHEKMARISPVDFEDTSKLDDINKAGKGKDNAVWFTLMFSWVFTFYIPYFIFMSIYLFSLKPILLLALIFIFIPVLLTQIIRANVFSKSEDKSAPVRRETEYYEKCIVSREYFKETRLLGAYGYFKKLFSDNLELLNKIRFKSMVKADLIELALKIITAAGYSGILYLLFDALMKQQISVGAFAAVFASINKIYQFMKEVICYHLGGIAQDLGTIHNFINFLKLKERPQNNGELKINSDIEFNNVSFAYPNSKPVLENINFKINTGETIAVVGENGSGKSTLIKLLSGLYNPVEGSVFYGNVNIKDINSNVIFSKTSSVFQKYQRYKMTLEDNISISDSEKEIQVNELDDVCDMSGVDKDNDVFANGYETMLSREFDGIDLSGGQWQRIAIARGLFKTHDLIILDEPTAAIDPFEETRIYNRFAEISKNKTAVIVTHRLGSVKLADRIIVLKNGGISETGTHDELISLNGEYKRMFIAQQKCESLSLVIPDLSHEAEYCRIMDRWEALETNIQPELMRRYSKKLGTNVSFARWLEWCEDDRTTGSMLEKNIPCTLYFLVNSNNEILGSIVINHANTHRGHLHAGIVPWCRGKGYGTVMLKLALSQCLKMGFQRVQIVPWKDNKWAIQTIIRNGGVLLEEFCENNACAFNGFFNNLFYADKDSDIFTNEYETLLSREFDGIDLSGGQWQRIAIARGLYKTHDLIILDEPTAAIDPFEETRIYNRFAEISKNKTAVIVTHRLGSVKLADRIIVLKNGRISETGTHDELISLNGEYKRMFIAQQKWYIKNE
ncbi:atp-binding cassette sub-family b [Holotrichia oblita]|nr:atp-binding cassette sub-family b [Holotrichia oblita]